MPDLNLILHNIADHTETLLDVLDDPAIDAEFKSRMLEHILYEEEQNTAELKAIENPQDEHAYRIAVDHSYFLQKMIRDHSIPMHVKKSLLDHFAEEHREMAQKSPSQTSGLSQASTGSSSGNQWTVGPMTGSKT